jgi:hypothetical protein
VLVLGRTRGKERRRWKKGGRVEKPIFKVVLPLTFAPSNTPSNDPGPNHFLSALWFASFGGLNHTSLAFRPNSECSGEKLWLACG